jgi:aminotransferase
MNRSPISHKAARFTESVIRGMSIEARTHGAINLAQGMPDFPAPAAIKAAACRAIEDDIKQYAITWGAKNLREAIAEKTLWHLGLAIDPETEITVTCGSTEAMLVAASLINLAASDPHTAVFTELLARCFGRRHSTVCADPAARLAVRT